MASAAPEEKKFNDLFGQVIEWDEFVNTFTLLIRCWCKRWSTPPSEIDDVIQEVFLEVLACRRFEYRNALAVMAWVRTVSWRCHCRALRKRLRVKCDVLNDSNMDQFATSFVDEHECLAQREILNRVIEEVKIRVAPTKLLVLERTVVGNDRPSKVAEELGISLDTLYVIRSRIRKLMRGIAEELCS